MLEDIPRQALPILLLTFVNAVGGTLLIPVLAGVALLIGPAMGSYSAASSLGFLGPALLAIAISAGTLAWMAATLTESLPPSCGPRTSTPTRCTSST